MRVSISFEGRFGRTPDGAVWTDGPSAYALWARYLDAFESVNVIARVEEISNPASSLRRADGPGVSFSPVPHYLGPTQYLLRARQVHRAAQGAVAPDDAVILTVPGQISGCIEPALVRGRPYAVQVIGDPYDVFAPGVIRHPLRPLFRWWFSRQMRQQVARASAVQYVTQTTLQSRYPSRVESVGITDVELTGEAFAVGPRVHQQRSSIKLVSVGTMTQLYKGHDVLIDALAEGIGQGLDLRLVLVGDGKYRATLEELARSRGLQDRIEFRGQLAAGSAVRTVLDEADLFVLPSRTEGLPRALLEAMARGLPCIASRVGGIPELLPDEDLVPAADVSALARKIREVVSEPSRMANMSARNLDKTGEFRAELLREQRNEFYRRLADQTSAWLGSPSVRESTLPVSTACSSGDAHG